MYYIHLSLREMHSTTLKGLRRIPR